MFEIMERFWNKPSKTAFTSFLNLCAKKAPDLEAMLKSKKELVIADVGSCSMPYSGHLYAWAERFGRPRIYAVDPELNTAGLSEEFRQVPERIEDSAKYFVNDGISHIDLFTIFNPRPRSSLPNITKLGKLSTNSIVMLTYGEAPDELYTFEDELEDQGMRIIKQPFPNPYSSGIRMLFPECGYDYSPVIIAQAP
jgi:hypothetical protein